MLLIGILITLIAATIIPKVRPRGGVDGAKLGWMSERWLAEHRASHPQ